jgi:hypothetical protein
MFDSYSGCCYGGGFLLTANDIAPAYSGIIFGISNTFATIPGIISPYVVGALTEKVRFFNHLKVLYQYLYRIQTIGVMSFSFVPLSILLGQSYFYSSVQAKYNHGH